MAVTEEESSSSLPSSSSSARSPANGAHYLAKCILPSSVVLQVVQGHIRSPTSNDIVFAKETSIELVIIGEDGIVQSVCEQTVFGTIKDIAVLPWNEDLHAKNSQIHGKDLLLVSSDSGKLSFLTFCSAMHRFFAVTHIQLSKPGNSLLHIGRMVAVHSSGGYVAVSAHEERLALLSIYSDNDCNMVDKKMIYPPEKDNDEESDAEDAITGIQRAGIFGTIWSMSFISKGPANSCKEDCPILAILQTRKGNSWNELIMVRWNVRENAICVLSKYVEDGALALNIIEVPHSYGFALLCRVGDIYVMDLRDAQNPFCVHKVNLTSLVSEVEEQTYVEDPLRMHDGDDEGFIAASALLELQDHAMVFHEIDDPMNVDTHSSSVKGVPKYVCSWSWEPGNEKHNQRMIYCVDTGEFFMIEITLDRNGVDVHLSDCIYENVDAPCKPLLWVEGGFLAAIVEMGDGMILKLKDGVLNFGSLIQNISPILDMSAVDYYNENEKQDHMFACCGVAPEGSLRIIRNGISVERLLRTAATYQGITGTWTLRMKVVDPHHSFLVLSFVEETRVLTVGLSFSDVTDSVGFLPDVCTLGCGLVDDRLLVQIHRNAVRLCLPTITAHPEGIPMSSPICTSWSPDNLSISLGSVAHNLITVATSSPCVFIILGVRFLSVNSYEVHELQSIRLHSELSCMSILQKPFLQRDSTPSLNPPSMQRLTFLPVGVDSGTNVSFVIGTHKPSVEVLLYSPGQGIRVIAVGIISMTNTFGVALSGCIPQDVRFAVADRLYILCGLRNGMLLRFEWLTTSSESFNQLDIPVYLQRIAIRRIGITPVFLVPLNDSLDADIIALSDRPWLIQTARHSLSYISISFQPSTHVTPVCSSECPRGLLFVVENSLNLVEMAPSRRLNVQKFHLGGTTRKILYHADSKLLLVMRTDVGGAFSSSSGICCVDPLSGLILSSLHLEHGETAKCMALVKVGIEQVLVVGTSLSPVPAVMTTGEAQSSTKGRLLVLSLVHQQSLRRSLSFNKNSGFDSDKMFNSSAGSSPDDSSDRLRLEDGESWNLMLISSVTWPGIVLAVCPYLDRYFLASSGNAFYVCSFPNDSPHKVRRLAAGKTRFVISSLTAYFARIAVGDVRDGVLFYSYHEESRKLELLYGDPGQRLVADCLLMDTNTAVVSDRMGSIAVLTSSGHLEDTASAGSNLTVSCSYYMGEIAVCVRKGSFSYKLSTDGTLSGCEGGDTIFDLSRNGIMAGTLLGSIMMFIPLSREEYELLKAVQAKLAVHPLTAPILGNDHAEFRGRENKVGAPQILDGDLLGQFLELTSIQQETVLDLPCASTEMTSSFRSPHVPVSVSQVVPLLERIHYALN